MDSSVLYGIMVFSPIIFWIAKVSLSYRIQYDLLPRKHGKYFIKRNKTGFYNGYLCMCFRKSLPFLVFTLNLFLGWWLILSTLASIVYLLLWLFGHQIQYVMIPSIQMKIAILTWYIHVVLIIIDKIINWIKKK